MDYAMPRASMFPMFKVDITEDATRGNPLRIKGGGEGGTTPASAVIMNAVLHALAPLGVRHLDMPATPERVWAAINAAENGEQLLGILDRQRVKVWLRKVYSELDSLGLSRPDAGC
jgi:xanthine dehydrogenase molybdopterin-binding subunit B